MNLLSLASLTVFLSISIVFGDGFKLTELLLNSTVVQHHLTGITIAIPIVSLYEQSWRSFTDDACLQPRIYFIVRSRLHDIYQLQRTAAPTRFPATADFCSSNLDDTFGTYRAPIPAELQGNDSHTISTVYEARALATQGLLHGCSLTRWSWRHGAWMREITVPGGFCGGMLYPSSGLPELPAGYTWLEIELPVDPGHEQVDSHMIVRALNDYSGDTWPQEPLALSSSWYQPMLSRTVTDPRWQLDLGGRTVQRQITAMPSIVAGVLHSCMLFSNGQAGCVGLNNYGQLGLLGRSELPSLGEVRIDFGGQMVASISAGNLLSCAVMMDGSAVCWGGNGLHGLGTTTPVAVPGMHRIDAGNRSFLAISAGAYASCAIFTDGSAVCFGDNTYGQLGAGEIDELLVPGNFSIDAGGRKWLVIATASYHSCGVFTDGSAVCFGKNVYGQLGILVSDLTVPGANSIDAQGRNFSTISAATGHTVCPAYVRHFS